MQAPLDARPDALPATIPVTLLTGFLGSGKTTLLNALLRDPGIGRVAVIINEFGDVGLDHDLVQEATEELVLMRSGCLCCSIRGDLVATLLGLLGRREAGEVAFDRVVIETTGLADPGPILQTLLLDPDLARAFRLDGVVTTADAATGPRTLRRQFEAVSQIALADRVVITKTDLVLPAEAAAFAERIASINPGAARITADHGAVPPGTLFDIGAPGGAPEPERTLEWINAPAYAARPVPLAALPPEPPAPGLFGLGRALPTLMSMLPGQRSHDSRIGSLCAVIEEPIPEALFDLWLDTLIAFRGHDILRMKDIVFVEGMEAPFALHGVQHVFHPPVPLRRWPEGDRASRIVIIGRDLPANLLENTLAVLGRVSA